MKLIPEETRIQQINALPNIEFVRWADGYHNCNSKAVCRCDIDGFEWLANVKTLVHQGSGCPQCSGVRRWTAEERIKQINQLPNIEFVRWQNEYLGIRSKAFCRCRIDGFEWAATVNSLLKGHGCQHCAGNRRWTAAERAAQINALPDIIFVRWADGYKNKTSKAVCQCEVCSFEWAATPSNLLKGTRGTGCPQCAPFGYDKTKSGTLYILRSECGSMVKIGISNHHIQRHAQLRRNTPFDWSCVELLHSDDGALMAEWEKELHNWTEQVDFKAPFDGSTEWRKWDDRLPKWIKRFRARLKRYNKAP